MYLGITSINDISRNMFSLLPCELVGNKVRAAVTLAKLAVTGAAIVGVYTLHRYFGRSKQLVLTGEKTSKSTGERGYALKFCDLLVGKQQVSTIIVKPTPEGVVALTAQALKEVRERAEDETYMLHKVKFQKKDSLNDKKTILEQIIGDSKVVSEIKDRTENANHQVATATAYLYKQGVCRSLPVVASGIDYFNSAKKVKEQKNPGILESVASNFLAGAQVNIKQEVADWVEKNIDIGAAWTGHMTADILTNALVDALVLHIGNNHLVKGGVCVTEVLSASSLPEGAARLLRAGIRELSGSSTLSTAAYVGVRVGLLGGQVGFLLGKLLIQSYQNQLMVDLEKEEVNQKKEEMMSDNELDALMNDALEDFKKEEKAEAKTQARQVSKPMIKEFLE